MSNGIHESKQWLVVVAICCGVLMIVLASTIVNVALPEIQTDLGFSETSFVWVVNAYTLTFGGFLLLGGRLADVYGLRKLFLIGIVIFTTASLTCGLTTSQTSFIFARGAQGLGGAVVSAVALSLIVKSFPEQAGRARAIGAYGFVCFGGASIGVLLGAVVVSLLNWRCIFLMNLPIGVFVLLLCMYLISIPSTEGCSRESLDVAGASTVTTALTLMVYAVISSDTSNGASRRVIWLLITAATLFIVFLAIELRVSAPLVPLRMFRSRVLSVANIVAVLWASARFVWFFMSPLYLQGVLGCDALHVAFAFLPANVAMAVVSLGVSARLVIRFGLKVPLAGGLLLAAIGLMLFSVSPQHGTMFDVIPGMVLLGIGTGMALNPLIIASVTGVHVGETGLACGLANTASMLGGALGLALIARVGAEHRSYLLAQGVGEVIALNAGYHMAFAMGAVACIAAMALTIALIPGGTSNVPIEQNSGIASS